MFRVEKILNTLHEKYRYMEKQSILYSYSFDKETKTSKHNIFKNYLSRKSIFKNKEFLLSSFIPDEILHRDKEIMEISSIIAPSLRGYKPNNIFIYGGVGTGKTICIKKVLEQLNEISLQNKSNIKTIYINCKMKRVADTEYRLLAQLLNEVGVLVPDTGLPTDVLYKKFFNEIDKKKQIILIVLDEIDALIRKVGDEFLYNLIRINSELNNTKISIIGITNDLTFTNYLDARIKSSLGEEEIIFHPYNATQLRDILKQRAKEAFNKNTIKINIINKCAAIAAQEHGDARRALDLLRVAGEIAERENSSEILEKHVNIAEEKIELDTIIETIRSLPKQSQAILYAIINNKSENKISTKEVFAEYKKICLKNNLRVLTQRRVSDLINELDILGIIDTKVISKGRYGRTREISLLITNDILDNAKKILIPIFE